MEDFEAMGLFWTPDNPGQQHQGVLTHINGQETLLKLAGFNSTTIHDPRHEAQNLLPTEIGEVIHGSTTEGQITLLGWYKTYVQSRHHLSGSWMRESITAQELIVEAHCDQTSSIISWTVELEKVKEWVHLGFRRLNKEFDQGQTPLGTLHIGTTQSTQANVTGQHVTDITKATMVYDLPQKFSQARQDIAALEQILTLATGIRSAPQNIDMRTDSSQQSFDFYSRMLQGSRNNYEPSAFHAPLLYQSIAGSGIAKWIGHHRAFALPLHAMLNIQRDNPTNTVSEVDFLTAWLAAEFYFGQEDTNQKQLARFAGDFCTAEEKQAINVQEWAKAVAKARNDIVHMNEPQPEPALWIESADVLRMLVARKMLDWCDLDWTQYTTGFGHQQMLNRIAHTMGQI